MEEVSQAKPLNSVEKQIQELRQTLQQLLHPTEGIYAKIQEIKAETEVANLRLISMVDMVELRLTEHRKYLSNLIDDIMDRIKNVEEDTTDAQTKIGVLETKVEHLGESKKIRRGFIYGGVIAVGLWLMEAVLGPLKALWELLFTIPK